MEREDKISSLPRNVIDQIFGSLPLRDAVRSSILSRTWRYMWAENPKLEISKQFSEDIMRNRCLVEFQRYYVDLVQRLLLQRHGQITDFVLDVPKLASTQYSNVDVWMLFLSRQGLGNLRLDNSNNPTPYKIRSCIFSCPTLTRLTLFNCVFKVPIASKSFNVLTHLSLGEVTFEPSVLILPKLLSLKTENCRGIQHFSISAQQLSTLVLIGNDFLKASDFLNCTHLKYAYLASNEVACNTQNETSVDLTKLLNCWPKLRQLILEASILKSINAGDTVPERLPTRMHGLEHLIIFDISYHMEEIEDILRLICQVFLNLSTLEIWAASIIHTDMSIVKYLEEQSLVKQSINGLTIVQMIDFHGSRTELLFVKMLLANCPSIERMYINEKRNINPSTRLQTTKQLMQFPRASPKAEIIFQEDVPLY